MDKSQRIILYTAIKERVKHLRCLYANKYLKILERMEVVVRN